MIESLHTGLMVNIRNGGKVCDTFAITNCVKQGCVLAPTLFYIFLSAMFEDAFRDMGDGIYIQSRQDTDLGSIIASDGHIEAELQKRMSKASMSFGRLRERLWNNHNVSITVKGKSTVRSYCPPYCTGLRHGRCIGGM